MARIERSIEVHAPLERVYERLQHFEEYPGFMQEVRGVRRIGARGLQWETGHGERARSWEAELTDQVPGRRLAWRHVHGPRYEAAFELAAANAHAAGAAPVTRVTWVVECEPHEQMPGEPGDARQALQERVERDLARLKKHIEHHDPSGVHMVSATGAAVASPDAATAHVGAGAGAGSATAYATRASTAAGEPESIGKTIGQTAAERQESAQSQVGSGTGTRSWRRAPSLPEIWDLWQQPFRVARRVGHEVERAIEVVRGGAEPLKGALKGAMGGTRGSTIGDTREDAGRDASTVGGAWAPAVETAQRGREFIVCAELPGLTCDEVQVEIKHDRLTIAGERRPEPWHEPREERHTERSYGHFYRAIALPPGAQPEQAEAAMHDGVLEIKVPLAEYADRPRRLDVRPH